MTVTKKTSRLVSLVLIAILAVGVIIANSVLDRYSSRIVSLCAINVVLAVGLNIIYGFGGMFSLGHAGFMAVGAYVATLLTLSPAAKEANFFMIPIEPWLLNIQLPFALSLIIGGLCAALIAVLIGLPVLKLGDDYLGVATLGFAEIIRVVINNLPSVTNGSLGIKDLPNTLNLMWTFGAAALAVAFAWMLSKNSYGRALKAIRENEIAAEASGIKLLSHKVMAFALGAFFAGVGGAMLAFWSNTVDPKMFTITATFQVLTFVVAGGLGNITGTVIITFLFTILMEWLRFIEGPINLGFVQFDGVPGMRMLLFSLLLLVIILKFGKGLLGSRELSINGIVNFFHKLRNRLMPKKGGQQ